jgi:hydrogenase maturation protein HypF
VHQALGADAAANLRFPGIEPGQVAWLVELLERISSTTVANVALATTSAGRLFDGVAALALGISISDYEAEPAARWEAVCDRRAQQEYPLGLDPRPAWPQLDWRPLIRCLVDDIANRLPASIMAARFHRAMARGIHAVADRFAALPVVLCGGCFQNRMLTETVIEMACDRTPGFATPGRIPTGDGGLAAGQLAVALANWEAAVKSPASS